MALRDSDQDMPDKDVDANLEDTSLEDIDREGYRDNQQLDAEDTM